MVNIKVLNAGAWARSSERVPVSLPTEVSDVIICLHRCSPLCMWMVYDVMVM